MKILYITRKYPPSIGGMQTMNYNLIESLGRKVTVEKIAWGGSQAYLPVFIISAYIKACVHLRKKFDLLITGDALLAPLGLMLKKQFNIKALCIVHGLDVTFPNRIYQYLIVSSLKRLDKIVCVSKNTREECQKRGLFNIAVIPNGVRLPPYEPGKARQGILDPAIDNKKILLTMGRLVKRKGIAEFVANVISKLSGIRNDFVYIIIGEGKERGRIEDIISRLGLHDKVRLLGRCSDDVARQFFYQAKLFIMPNIRVEGDVEGFGIAALEASGCGLPVLASDVDGLSDVVKESQNGILIPCGRYGVFIDKINYFLDNDFDRLSLSEKAQNYVRENFGWDSIAERYLSVCRKTADIR